REIVMRIEAGMKTEVDPMTGAMIGGVGISISTVGQVLMKTKPGIKTVVSITAAILITIVLTMPILSATLLTL
ncbi:MAG: hypothetical protein K0R22_3192, partial [Sporomusa sp.]|nr:hypothetical protein [Sporomusa sp.]